MSATPALRPFAARRLPLAAAAAAAAAAAKTSPDLGWRSWPTAPARRGVVVCWRCCRRQFAPAAGARRYGTSAATRGSRSKHEEEGPAAAASAADAPSEDRSAVALRIRELAGAGALQYPRYQPDGSRLSVPQFRAEFGAVVQAGDESAPQRRVELGGRVLSVQRLGAKLAFLKLLDEGEQVQVMCNLRQLRTRGGGGGDAVSPAAFKEAVRLLNRGDHVAVTGRAMRTAAGELTLAADALPRVYAPALQPLPARLRDGDTRAQRRHVDLLVNPAAAATLRLRARLLRTLRGFLEAARFVEVQTPILADLAGGAVARPFLTSHGETAADADAAATGPAGEGGAHAAARALSLRIAPELWLKRLVVGGLDRVFEIGPAFRNEGVDATHNPEFTMCEFYAAYWTLPRLVAETERLLALLAQAALQFRAGAAGLPSDDATLHVVRLCAAGGPFLQLEFAPALEAALGFALPDLAAPDAYDRLRAQLAERGHPEGSSPADADADADADVGTDGGRLVKLLDRLAGAHLEPRSHSATGGGPLFITHHPACMSPLAKSFVCPRTGQAVAARAELFVDGRELANMYEEENDPAAQRAKMARQGAVDENYLAALEAGLPPTGGWGCGVDRLVMLFAGARRIADCLSFGTLRHVVAMRQ